MSHYSDAVIHFYFLIQTNIRYTQNKQLNLAELRLTHLIAVRIPMNDVTHLLEICSTIIKKLYSIVDKNTNRNRIYYVENMIFWGGGSSSAPIGL